MHTRLSVFALLCFSSFAACASDDSPSPSLDGAADGGTSLPGEAGAFDAQATDSGGGSPAQGDAGPEGGTLPGGDAGPAGACPAKFTTATYMRMQMSWPGSIGYLAGEDVLQAWAKTTFTRAADGMLTESVLCGVAFPIVSTTLLLGEVQLANDFPVSAFEQPTMPRAKGRASWQGGRLVLDVGANVLGATLSDPGGPWPAREALTPADHDADGKPGLTLVPRKDPPFGLPPGDILMTEYLDALYTASRMAFRLTGSSEGCSAPADGEVEPLAFNYTVVGCHIVNGGDCGESEVNLIENQSPIFTPTSGGRWRSVPIAENATCADVRSAIPR